MPEQTVTVSIPVESLTQACANDARPSAPRRWLWAAARGVFMFCAGLCLFTVVAGVPLAPLITWWVFGDWRFWRHLKPGLRLYVHGYRVLGMVLRGEGRFMFSVPLTSPPIKVPVPGSVRLNPEWTYGNSCGPCRRCCHQSGSCPALDDESGRCRGYNAFYWRYFNCGRFPSNQQQIDYYDCPKWIAKG